MKGSGIAGEAWTSSAAPAVAVAVAAVAVETDAHKAVAGCGPGVVPGCNSWLS